MPLAAKRGGISRLIIPAVIIVVVAIGGASVFLLSSSTGTTTTQGISTSTTSGATPSTSLRSQENAFINAFNGRDVGSLVNNYASNALVVWSGNTQGLSGSYSGQGNMKILYGATIAKTTKLTVTLSNYNENDISPTIANVTGTITMSGNSTVLGGLNATIDISQNWANSGGQWQITKENWNYKTFTTQFTLSSTTFPQWGLMKQGKNPNLVSEKSFEWNAGPFVAAGVYAFLASVAVFGVMKFRSRPK